MQIFLVVLVRSAVYVPRDRMEGNFGKKESGSIFAAHTDVTEWLESDEKGAADFSMRAAISGDNTLVGTYFSNLKSSNRTGISCCNICIATGLTVMFSDFILSRRWNNLSEGWTNAHTGDGVASACSNQTTPHLWWHECNTRCNDISFQIIHEGYHRWCIVGN